jgi:hypothetical protein
MILMAAGGLASALASKPKKPPPAIAPATEAAPARESGAVVRLGDGNELKAGEDGAVKEVGFVEKRKQAQALGGLGRSGGLGL